MTTRVMRFPEVAAAVRLSKAAIYDKIAKGKFPQRGFQPPGRQKFSWHVRS